MANPCYLTYAEALAAIWASQCSASTPLHTASEGNALSQRVAGIERSLEHLAASTPSPPAGAAKARASSVSLSGAKGAAAKLRAHAPSHEAQQFPGLDPGVVQAALGTGMEASAHERMQPLMQPLMQPGPLSRLRPEPGAKRFSKPLEESEEEDDEVPLPAAQLDGSGSLEVTPCRSVGELWCFLTNSSSLEGALDGAGASGSRESSRELDDHARGRHASQHQRAGLVRASRVGAFPTVVNLT